MGRTYQGYIPADQSVLEEEENQGSSGDDLEANHGRSHIFQNPKSKAKSRSHRKSRVSWGAGASEMSVLHPNIHQEDKIHEHESSDDEVPQSFMIEASSRKPVKDTVVRSSPSASPRQATNLSLGKKVPRSVSTPLPSVSAPPQPLEDGEYTPRPSVERVRSTSNGERQPKPMRGLDDYERALWNWVNVYNLDAFLQEVYYYYEGKGIYSIALARGLNLLLVMLPLWIQIGLSDLLCNARTVGFVIGFSTFLLGCIDYSRIRPEGITRLSEVVVHRCVAKYVKLTVDIVIV